MAKLPRPILSTDGLNHFCGGGLKVLDYAEEYDILYGDSAGGM